MRNKHPRLWPFDRQTVGNKTGENGEEKKLKKEQVRAVPSKGQVGFWHCLIENHAALS